MHIRLLALDLDGTLFGDDGVVRPRVRRAIAAALERGVIVTLATGRAFDVAARYARDLGIEAPLICYQGAVIQDMATGQVLYTEALPADVLPEIVTLAEERGWDLHFSTARSKPSSADQAEAILAELSTRFAGRLNIVRSHDILIEGIAAGVTKGRALAKLAGMLGAPQAAVMAIGDHDNDAPMIAWAGLGVAMGDAAPTARAAARWLAPPLAEDGAAVAIERFVLTDD